MEHDNLVTGNNQAQGELQCSSDISKPKYTGKKYIFQYWNVVGLLLYYHWSIIGSFTGYSNFGKWLYFPTLENGCYSFQQYSNVSNIGILYFPTMEDRFPT